MSNLNFRSALHGFNREDVVRYLETSNARHEAKVNQLRGELQAARQELDQLRETSANKDVAETLARLEQENEALRAEVASLQAALPAPAEEPTPVPADYRKMELDAYRRAERAERAAQQRVSKLYDEALGVLADSTAQVESASTNLEELTVQAVAAVESLRHGLEESRSALQSASAKLYAVKLPAQEE